jgi:ABC-type thiamin/hydroxymethylpyrimidine transport system permease subunit
MSTNDINLPLWFITSTVGAVVDRQAGSVTFPENKMAFQTAAVGLEFAVLLYSSDGLAHEYIRRNKIENGLVVALSSFDELCQFAIGRRDDYNLFLLDHEFPTQATAPIEAIIARCRKD